MHGEGYGKPSLIETAELPKTDKVMMTQFIDPSLAKIHGSEIPYELVRLLLLVTDAASNIIKTGEIMKTRMFPNLLHVTCLAHGLHRLADFIQFEHEVVDMPKTL